MNAATIAGYVAIGLGAIVVLYGAWKSDTALVTVGAGMLGGPAVANEGGRE